MLNNLINLINFYQIEGIQVFNNLPVAYTFRNKILRENKKDLNAYDIKLYTHFSSFKGFMMHRNTHIFKKT